MKCFKRWKFFLGNFFFGLKTSKTWFLGQKWWKNEKIKKFWSKKFFGPESIQNVLKSILKQKSRNRKFFPITKFFLGLNHFLAKTVKKWLSQKILIENFFWSESIRNVSKRILNQKSRNREFFRLKFIFWRENLTYL